ncbi:MAG: exodeoxyribonuclease III [Desulfopila sp.]
MNTPVPVVDLIAVQTKDPYRVLVATILSARTKDETTAKAAERLFRQAGNIDELARLSRQQIEKLIFPVGFFRNKAEYLTKLPASLVPFGNQVPKTIDELVKLPGVGRKTANLVRSVAFNLPAICVDTHVHRIMNIWQYVTTNTPLQTEMALREKLPEKHWIPVNSLLVAFGQSLCKPVRPHCDICPLRQLCPKTGVIPRSLPKTASRAKGKGGEVVKCISWNVNGIRAVEKKGFVDILASLDADIIGLQETKAQRDQLSEALLQPDGYFSYWHSAERKGYSGVAVYTRKRPIRVIEGLGEERFDREGRILTLEYEQFFFSTIYFPNAGDGLKRLDYKLDFNDKLVSFINDLRDQKPVVVCGDFNVAHKPIDIKNPESNEKNAGYTPEERHWLDTFIEAGYVDTFRIFNHDPDNYTWWSYRYNARARNIGWRIDYFFTDNKDVDKVITSLILADITGSDHCPIQLEYRV